MFYYYKKQEIDKGKCFCVYQSQTKLTNEEIEKINKNQNDLLKDIIVYESNMPFVGYPIIEGETIRPANERELIDLGLLSLRDGEILEGDHIVKVHRPSWQYKWESPNWIIDEAKLQEGEIVQEGSIVKVEKPNGVKVEWNFETKEYEDLATPEERKTYIGKYIGEELLMKVLANGCEVTIREEQHTQTLDSRKLLMLSSTGSGVLMALNAQQSLETIPWSFNDDGSDSLVLTIEEFNSLALQCLAFVTKCYIVADILKAQDRIDLTIEDFNNELAKQQ